MASLAIGALLFGVYIRAPDFGQLPSMRVCSGLFQATRVYEGLFVPIIAVYCSEVQVPIQRGLGFYIENPTGSSGELVSGLRNEPYGACYDLFWGLTGDTNWTD